MAAEDALTTIPTRTVKRKLQERNRYKTDFKHNNYHLITLSGVTVNKEGIWV